MTFKQHSATARTAILGRVSQAGVCENVVGYEPKSAPPRTGIHASVVNSAGRVAQFTTTLAGATAWQTFTIYLFRVLELHDTIMEELVDPELSDARDTIIDQFMADVTLSAGVEIDIAGAWGPEPMRWEPAYIDMDNTKYRHETITVPVVLFNAWDTVRT